MNFRIKINKVEEPNVTVLEIPFVAQNVAEANAYTETHIRQIINEHQQDGSYEAKIEHVERFGVTIPIGYVLFNVQNGQYRKRKRRIFRREIEAFLVEKSINLGNPYNGFEQDLVFEFVEDNGLKVYLAVTFSDGVQSFIGKQTVDENLQIVQDAVTQILQDMQHKADDYRREH